MYTPKFLSFIKEDTSRNAFSGFLVFLLALPLCMGIAVASGFPPAAGIMTGIFGGIITTFISNSQLTIKGPAAGLIVIVLGCMLDFGFTGGQNLTADFNAYKMTLAVGVAAGFMQIVLGKLRSGLVGEIVPAAAVHGLLAAIGVIIILKQFPVTLGLASKGSPLTTVTELKGLILRANPEILLTSVLTLLTLIIWPRINLSKISKIPAPIVAIGLGIALSFFFDFTHPHQYRMMGREFSLTENMVVNVPHSFLGSFQFPNFLALSSIAGWKWVAMFTLIGTLESVLSAKAVDLIDPKGRKTDLNREVTAIGFANMLVSALGGLPMISEIIRSKANIDSGATVKTSNFFHGIFLLIALIALGPVLHHIPLACLAAMLVYTGFRLAHPKEFFHMYRIGTDEFAVFLVTIAGTLATDLLVGLGLGIATQFLLSFKNGLRFRDFKRGQISIEENKITNSVEITPEISLVFAHWLKLKNKMDAVLVEKKNIVVNFQRTNHIDHTIMAKLSEYGRELQNQELEMAIVGLQDHHSLANHPLSARVLRTGCDVRTTSL